MILCVRFILKNKELNLELGSESVYKSINKIPSIILIFKNKKYKILRLKLKFLNWNKNKF